MLNRTETVRELLTRLLDAQYERAVGGVINSVTRATSTGAAALRLEQLQAEAARLAAAGERFTSDNPVLRAVLADMDTTFRRQAAIIDARAEVFQRLGADAAAQVTRGLSLSGLSGDQAALLAGRWNTPDPEQVSRLLGYIDSPAFQAELNAFPNTALEAMQRAILQGQLLGRSPLALAGELQQIATALPESYTRTLTRSLQLTAWRDATAVHQLANADILEPYAIRIASLDARTCMACVALHGTRVPLGTRVDDHRNGRCTSIAPVRGRAVNVTTGEAWFRALPEERQRAQMGTAAYNAWKAGAVELRQFARPAQDKVFGSVVTEASLKGLLGDAARQYYSR